MPSTTPNEPHRSPMPIPSLLSLPEELLAAIAVWLDRADASSLAQTCRALTATARCRLDREVDLALPPRFGDLAGSAPPRITSRIWAAKNRAMATRVRELLTKEREDRLAKAREAVISHPPGSTVGIVMLLQAVAPNLERLAFLERPTTQSGAEWDPAAVATLDIQMTKAKLAFPHLTHIKIHRYSIHYAELLIFLCIAAPNLVDADFNLEQDMRILNPDYLIPPIPKLVPVTKIRRMRLVFDSREGTMGGDNEEELEHSHPALQILAHSPRIEQLSVQYVGDGGYTMEFLAKTISALPELRELHWPVGPEEIFCYLDPAKPGFPSLRTLVVRYGSEIDYTFADLFEHLHTFPMLEALYIDRPSGKLIPPTADTSSSPVARQTTIHVPRFIRAHPKLRIIHSLPPSDSDVFSRIHDLEETGKYNGWVNSYRHGASELLHLRRLTHLVEIADTPAEVVPIIGRGSRMSSSRYISAASQDRRKVYEWQAEAVWEDITELEGLVVPLEILEEMRVVQDASLTEWEGRGIEVGDAAWKILTDWREGREKEPAAVKANGAK